MRPSYFTLTALDVQCYAELLFQGTSDSPTTGPSVAPRRSGPSSSTPPHASCSLAAACVALADAPSDTAVHDALLAGLPDFADLQRRLNRALQGDLPHALRRRRQPLAIDLTLIPYHGQPLHQANEIYRCQAKSGTTHFHAYATAYVIRKGLRFTVALTAVYRGEALTEVIRRLLTQAAQAAVRPRYLLLDRGFCSVDVIRYLQAGRRAFLMPVPRRGRKADHPKGPSGTQIFATWKRSGWGQYTMTNAKKRRATFAVCVKCRNRRGRAGPSRSGGVGVCLRGRVAAVVVPVGAGDVPEAFRHRDQLPAVAPGTDSDLHARSLAAVVVCGRGLGPAQRVGVAALGTVVAASAWWAAGGSEPIGVPSDVAVVATCRRTPSGGAGRNPCPTNRWLISYGELISQVSSSVRFILTPIDLPVRDRFAAVVAGMLPWS